MYCRFGLPIASPNNLRELGIAQIALPVQFLRLLPAKIQLQQSSPRHAPRCPPSQSPESSDPAAPATPPSRNSESPRPARRRFSKKYPGRRNNTFSPSDFRKSRFQSVQPRHRPAPRLFVRAIAAQRHHVPHLRVLDRRRARFDTPRAETLDSLAASDSAAP